MGCEISIIVFYTLVLAGLAAAWVGGYLDKYQSRAQDYALGRMGENKASYGLKSTVKSQRLGDNKQMNDVQDNIADDAGRLVGKGGIGEGVGSGLSKGL